MYQAEKKASVLSKGINHLKMSTYSREQERGFLVRMEGKQDASIEAEGQFGKPEFFARLA